MLTTRLPSTKFFSIFFHVPINPPFTHLLRVQPFLGFAELFAHSLVIGQQIRPLSVGHGRGLLCADALLLRFAGRAGRCFALWG